VLHKAIQSLIRSLKAFQGTVSVHECLKETFVSLSRSLRTLQGNFLSLNDFQEMLVSIMPFSAACSNSKPYKVLNSMTKQILCP
jgi:hypothetical protein